MDILLSNYYALFLIPLGGRTREPLSEGDFMLYTIAVIYLMALLYITVRWINYRSPKKLAKPGPVSIIVCAHNEAQNLENNLPWVLAQQYGKLEVIVVNDRSTDHSVQILETLKAKFDRLRVITIEGTEGSKKQALHAGIMAATHNIILLTDADCRPKSPYWAKTMVGFMDEETDIVLGFSPYNTQPGLLNKLIRYETLMTAHLYGGLAMMGLPYMGVGRNLAYRKKVYLNSTAKDKYATTLSGDDDLLVNEMANSQNTRVCAESEALMWSTPKTTWADWWHQKRRHTEAGKHYSLGTKAILSFIYIPQILLYFLVLALLIASLFFGSTFIWFALGLLAVRFLVLIIALPATMNALEQASLLPFVLICDFLMSVFLFSLGCLSAIKVSTWSNNHHHNVHKKI